MPLHKVGLGREIEMKSLLFCGAATAVLIAQPVWAQDSAPTASVVEELIVTAQKKEESVQDVPIAVSAFTANAMKAQGIEGARDLVQSVPNISFQRRTQRANFQIRGIGSQLSNVAGDDGVGIHLNNAPLTFNFLAESDFFDVERVEVLRGPQGTLYGRNATGGVVNVITNKPSDQFSASVTADIGNYDSRRLQGYVNVPLNDMFDLRVAAYGLDRSGYTKNTLTGSDVDGRSIRGVRATLGFHPTDNFRAFLMYDSFSEDDSRGGRKQLCAKDVGLTSVLGVPTGVAQASLTQGCLGASVYSAASYGTTNQLSSFSGIIARQTGIQPQDSFLGKTVTSDLREIEMVGRPIYRPRAETWELNADWNFTDDLKLTSLTSYTEIEQYTRYDSTGGYSSVVFPNSPLVPTGTINDPQFGLVDRLQSEQGRDGHNTQFTQELRVQSSFDGPWNFNVGAIYVKFKTHDITYVSTDVLATAAKAISPAIYVDPLRNPDYSGHDYYVALTDYQLSSKAAFGEVYWKATDTLKATLGLRYTEDNKQQNGSQSTLFTPGRGYVYSGLQKVQFTALTGRFNLDWSPELSFTNKTLIYASYSRGYKGGGFNGARVVDLGLSSAYQPEYVNAYEIGTKNTLLDGSLLVNLTAFYYNYKGYQIARPVNRVSYTENIDATIKGLEFEGIWEPVHGLRFNANLGYLDTNIDSGHVVDSFNRTQGNSNYVYGNSTQGGCIYNAQGIASLLSLSAGPSALNALGCGGPATLRTRLTAAGVPTATVNSVVSQVFTYGSDVNLFSNGNGEGVVQNLKGNQLPNAPHFTAAIGAQYKWDLNSDWNATIRGDFYHQSRSEARFNNASFDGLRAWDNVNASVIFNKPSSDLTVQFYVRNALGKDTIVGYDVNDENLGSTRILSILDPRLYGVSITKNW